MLELREDGCGFGRLGQNNGEVVQIEVSGVGCLHGLAVWNADDFPACGCLLVVAGRIGS